MGCNFDFVVCRYPLPGNPPEFLKHHPAFQTKDLGGGMGDFEITPAGEIRPVFDTITVEACKKLGLDITAPLNWKRKRIEIYTSNISGGRPTPEVYKFSTFDGEAVCNITYAVNIRNGRVSSIKELGRRS